MRVDAETTLEQHEIPENPLQIYYSFSCIIARLDVQGIKKANRNCITHTFMAQYIWRGIVSCRQLLVSISPDGKHLQMVC